jgi:hypothetical protein
MVILSARWIFEGALSRCILVPKLSLSHNRWRLLFGLETIHLPPSLSRRCSSAMASSVIIPRLFPNSHPYCLDVAATPSLPAAAFAISVPEAPRDRVCHFSAINVHVVMAFVVLVPFEREPAVFCRFALLRWRGPGGVRAAITMAWKASQRLIEIVVVSMHQTTSRGRLEVRFRMILLLVSCKLQASFSTHYCRRFRIDTINATFVKHFPVSPAFRNPMAKLRFKPLRWRSRITNHYINGRMYGSQLLRHSLGLSKRAYSEHQQPKPHQGHSIQTDIDDEILYISVAW